MDTVTEARQLCSCQETVYPQNMAIERQAEEVRHSEKHESGVTTVLNRTNHCCVSEERPSGSFMATRLFTEENELVSIITGRVRF